MFLCMSVYIFNVNTVNKYWIYGGSDGATKRLVVPFDPPQCRRGGSVQFFSSLLGLMFWFLERVR